MGQVSETSKETWQDKKTVWVHIVSKVYPTNQKKEAPFIQPTCSIPFLRLSCIIISSHIWFTNKFVLRAWLTTQNSLCCFCTKNPFACLVAWHPWCRYTVAVAVWCQHTHTPNPSPTNPDHVSLYWNCARHRTKETWAMFFFCLSSSTSSSMSFLPFAPFSTCFVHFNDWLQWTIKTGI